MGTGSAPGPAVDPGVIPGLLLAGPLSDALSRRKVVLPVAGRSLAAGVVLVVGTHSVVLLLVGRLMAGVSTGVVCLYLGERQPL
jgi:MFS family permease